MKSLNIELEATYSKESGYFLSFYALLLLLIKKSAETNSHPVLLSLCLVHWQRSSPAHNPHLRGAETSFLSPIHFRRDTNPDAHLLLGPALWWTLKARVNSAPSKGMRPDLFMTESLAQFPQSPRNPFPLWFLFLPQKLPILWWITLGAYTSFRVTYLFYHRVWYFPHPNKQDQHLFKLVHFLPSLDYLLLSIINCLYFNTAWSMWTEMQCLLHRGDPV